MTDLATSLAQWATHIAAGAASPPVAMISGAQGIGKSTAMRALRALAAPRVAVLGVDDFYLPKAARARLARSVHPLCETRGPPGSHDLDLIEQITDRLLSATAATETVIPRFDKKSDDRRPQMEWPTFSGRPDIIVFEGWLMGALPDPGAPDAPPLNALEAREDRDGTWRRWQEDALAGAYLRLWGRSDRFLHLEAPAFEVVETWRLEQEATLFGCAPDALAPERRAWVARFIQHYERITRRMLAGLRASGDVIKVDGERRIARDWTMR